MLGKGIELKGERAPAAGGAGPAVTARGGSSLGAGLGSAGGELSCLRAVGWDQGCGLPLRDVRGTVWLGNRLLSEADCEHKTAVGVMRWWWGCRESGIAWSRERRGQVQVSGPRYVLDPGGWERRGLLCPGGC